MAQLEIATEELSQFRAIYAEACGEEIELAPGIFSIDESDITATDLTLDDFIGGQGRPYADETINGRRTLSYSARGGWTIVAEFAGKTLASGVAIKR